MNKETLKEIAEDVFWPMVFIILALALGFAAGWIARGY